MTAEAPPSSSRQPETLPLPRLTLRVGITGHRLDKLRAEDTARLRASLAGTFAQLDAALGRLHERLRGRLYATEPPQGRLVSALAEGADRLAVDAAPRGWALAALLPMPSAIYRQDFLAAGGTTSSSAEVFEAYLGAAETVTELPLVLLPKPGEPVRREPQYAALGRALVRQVDVLLAVWDGGPPKGPGGTAAVVAEAIDRGLAVVWIDPEGRNEPRRITRFRGGDMGRPDAEPVDSDAFDRMLEQFLVPELPGGRAPQTFSRPRPKPSRWAFAYPLLLRWAGAGRPRGGSGQRRRRPPADALLDALPASMPAAGAIDQIRRVLLPRSFLADGLAHAHVQLYRSAYVATFFVAGLSVPIGLLALFADKTPHALAIKALAVAAELAAILFVMWLVVRGRRQRWHANWIEARELSELLRLAPPLQLAGRAGELFEASPRAARSALQGFATWYARATVRELRPPAARLDAAYLLGILAAVRDRLLKQQIDYHRANATALERLDRFLHVWGDRCFMATIAVLVAYLGLFGLDVLLLRHDLDEVLSGAVKPFVTVAAAGLPAIGAALAGIRAQGEFANRARQSRLTLAELSGIAAEIDEIVDAPADTVLPDHASDLLVAAAQAMLDDVRHWRRVHVGKTLALPA